MMQGALQRSALLVALGLVAATLTGCLGLAMDEGAIQPVNRCTADSECAEHGGVCNTDLGACVAGGATDEAVVLHVSEPEGGGSCERQIVVSSSNPANPVTLTVVDTILVHGLVVDLRESSVPLTARMTFRRQTEYEGLSPEPISTESRDRTDEDESGDLYNYQVRLVPGRYDVEVEPTAETYSQIPHQLYYPMRVTVDVPSQTSPHVEDFEYDWDTIILSSVVIGPDGSPIGGVRVYAYDSATERRISNVALTQCAAPDDPESTCGRFSLALAPDSGDFRLRLRGSDSQPLLPSMDHSQHFSSRLDYNDDGLLDADEVGEISFPALEPPVLVDTVVEGRSRDGVVEPLVGATLGFRSTSTPSFVFEASATTDQNGRIVAEGGLRGTDGFGIWLRPATYRVVITPPPEGEHASGEVSLTVVEPVDGEAPPDETLLVGSRVLIEGSVLSPDGQPVPQVRIEAMNPQGGTFVTSTDEFGSYSLLVDPNVYDLLVAPPDQTLLAWTRNPERQFFRDEVISLQVGWGTPVNGLVVRESSSDPVGSALVEAYLVRASDEDGSLLVPFGRIRTAVDGSFTVLVPRDQPD